MKVVEKFVSINGEGTRAGELAAFVRFQGCNLNCGWCDTKWANVPGCPYEEMTPEEVAAWADGTGIVNITLTGGEPLLQPEMGKLLSLLLRDGKHRVEMETNGAVDIAPFCGEMRPVFTMDYKLPGSGCERRMIKENLALLGPEDTVKVVCAGREDLLRAKEITEAFGLAGRCHVYLSPVFGSIEPAEMVEFLAENRMNGVRLQIQMHKVIWDPEKRGV